MATTAQTFETLKEAVANNNFDVFNTAYITFLEQYPEFKIAHSTTPPGITVTNAIFGGNSFYLNQTTDIQADAILDKGKKASDIFRHFSVDERKEFLTMLEERIAQHKDEIGLTIVADTGKPIDLSAKEMVKGAEWFTFAKDQMNERLEDPKLIGGQISWHAPLGVAQIIGAYNYPYALAIGGIVGGLAGGNSVVVSAPLKAPNWVFPFKQAADEAVEQFITKHADKLSEGDAQIMREGLIQNSIGVNRRLTTAADVVHFVGSDHTGNLIKADRPGKKTILEMGGGNVVTVMKSAIDSSEAAVKIAHTIFDGFGPATGQRCTAPRVLCIQEGAEAVSDELKRICSEDMGGGHIGNPFESGIKMGPLVDHGAHQRIKDAITLAKQLGATVSGTPDFAPDEHNILQQARNANAYWVKPVVIDWGNVTDPQALKQVTQLIHQEIFGPLLHIVHPVKDLEEAIATTNKYDTHKLAGGIFTGDGADITKYHEGTNVTSLMVNAAPKDQSPYGPHGHPYMDKIGGPGHFSLYTDQKVRPVDLGPRHL